MAAITATRVGPIGKVGGGSFYRWHGTGASNQADTLSSGVVPAGSAYRVCYVTCAYDAAPTHAGVTVTLDSGLGALFDAVLHTGSANAQSTTYLPDGQLILLPGDSIIVAAPAGGANIEASIVICTEAL